MKSSEKMSYLLIYVIFPWARSIMVFKFSALPWILCKVHTSVFLRCICLCLVMKWNRNINFILFYETSCLTFKALPHVFCKMLRVHPNLHCVFSLLFRYGRKKKTKNNGLPLISMGFCWVSVYFILASFPSDFGLFFLVEKIG